MGHLNSSGISSSKLSGIGEGIHGKDGTAGVGDRSLGSNGDAGDARGSSRSIRYSLASRSKAAARQRPPLESLDFAMSGQGKRSC